MSPLEPHFYPGSTLTRYKLYSASSADCPYGKMCRLTLIRCTGGPSRENQFGSYRPTIGFCMGGDCGNKYFVADLIQNVAPG